jgi:tripartite-type tricarboxylate transporter receptor subunit TctC
MERGEVEGSATPLESLTSYRADWVRDRKIRILAQYTATRDAEIPDVPTMVELGRSEEARQILGFYASAAEVGRSIVAPPAVPAPTVATLRRAFEEMLVDPVFLEEGHRAGIQLKPMSGERLQDLVSRVGDLPPSLLEKARQARAKPN